MLGNETWAVVRAQDRDEIFMNQRSSLPLASKLTIAAKVGPRRSPFRRLPKLPTVSYPNYPNPPSL
jgi:hypothetical protein